MDEMQSCLQFCCDYLSQLNYTTSRQVQFYTYNYLTFILNYDNVKLHVNFICINEWLFFMHINIIF
jgi:hypothetical protein